MTMAILVGGCTGLAAVGFIRLIAFIQNFSYTQAEAVLPALGRLWVIIVPVLGALISGPIIAHFAMEAKGHGVPEVMQALIMRGGRIRPRVAVAKIFASALCIGSGGSAGREGPIVQVGSTLGSTIGQWLNLSDERIKNLVACGAAAGIAATFNAPIAGVVFATEVLLNEFRVSVFGNVLIAAVSSSIVSRIFLGTRPAFDVPSYAMNSPWEILLFGALGLAAALVGVAFIRTLNAFENLFDAWQFPLTFKPAVGAVLLGVMAFLYPYLAGTIPVSDQEMRLGLPLVANLPHVFGSGFPFLEKVLQGQASFWLLAMLIFLKPLATSFTLGSGNSGGVFAPSLFTGAMLGGAFGHVAAALFPKIAGAPGAYALVGMAAVFAAAARAPLTSILIVFEMSNDYHLILPLMAASMIASSFAQMLHPESIYTIKLAKRGIRFDQGHDLDVMQAVLVEEVMNPTPVTVHVNDSVADIFATFQETHLLGFPVIANDKELCGIVTMQDIEQALANHNGQVRNLKVRDVATPNPVTVFPDEPVWAAINKMTPLGFARLPVVSRQAECRIVGLISRSDILRAYEVGLMRKRHIQYIRDRMALRKVSGVEFMELTLTDACESKGKRLAKMKLPPNTTVVSIEREGILLIPDNKTTILPKDRITVFCHTEWANEVKKIFAPGQNKS